ncbi:MAG: hypothetical protein ACT4O1_11625 [Gemmatimonadota bacterium]
MEKVHTKEAAEALLRELPSVLGAFVREDVNGHPREIHLLVAPGPNVKLLAQDVRDLLEERLGVPIDHRIISIAQLAEDVVDVGQEASLENLTEANPPERRVRFINVASEVRDQRVRVRAQIETDEQLHEADVTELDVGNGRIRAAASATLRAAGSALGEGVQLELEAVSSIKAFDREYVLVSVLAGANVFGRSVLHLCGAQPVEQDVETAAALATLKAINRVMGKLLT